MGGGGWPGGLFFVVGEFVAKWFGAGDMGCVVLLRRVGGCVCCCEVAVGGGCVVVLVGWLGEG